jgi:zinc-ribbon domain
MYCPECGLEQPDAHRFCAACGTRLPILLSPEQWPKVTQMFLGIPTHPSDPPSPVLRVSHYLREIEMSSREGTVRVPGDHARFSIWPDDRPVCAMSLSEDESARLGRFLLSAAVEVRSPSP